MPNVPKTIKRGEIYLIDWNPSRGNEQSGLRPALVIQNDVGNRVSPDVIVAAFTTAGKTYPFTVKCKPSESGLDHECFVDLASILTISKTRLRTKCGQLNMERMAEVDKAIKVSLGLQ